MDIFVVVLLATFATLMVRRRAPKALPAAPASQLSEAGKYTVDVLEGLGFIVDPGLAGRERLKRDDVIFRVEPLPHDCKACGGMLEGLYRMIRPECDRFAKFGTVCVNCRHLVTVDERQVPERIRHAWSRTTELLDFVSRMKCGPEAEAAPVADDESEEPLAVRKARLERELAETEERRNLLRSELLSVKNRLDEPDDGPPHR